jgi:hypothetical protein
MESDFKKLKLAWAKPFTDDAARYLWLAADIILVDKQAAT